MTEKKPLSDAAAEEAIASVSGVPLVTGRDRSGDVALAFQSTPKERRTAFTILLLSVMCLGMGQTILFAVLPPIARRVGLADWQVGAVFTVSAMFWVLTSPYWGKVSDRKGRKPVILIGLGAFAISMLLLAFVLQTMLATTLPLYIAFGLMLVARCLHGGIGSAGPSSVQAYMADRTSAAERTMTMANFGAAFGLGATIGPGIGSAAAVIGPVAPIYAVSFVAFAAWIAIAWKLPERTRPQQRPASAGALKISDKRVFPILMYGLFAGLVNAVPLQVSGFYFLDVLEMPETDILQFVGVALMVMSMASLFSQLVLVQRFKMSPAALMRIAPLFLIIGHGIMAVSTTFGMMVFALLLIGLGGGMFIPAISAAASLAVEADEQGIAAGYANSSIGAGFIFTPILVFGLYPILAQLPFMVTAVLALGLAVYAHFHPAIRLAGEPVA